MGVYLEGAALYQTDPNDVMLSGKAGGFEMMRRRVVTKIKGGRFYFEILGVHIVLVKIK